MSGRFILDDDMNPVEEPDLIKWAAWFEKADRAVAKTTVGDAEVSTFFLGLDHAFGSGKPLLFETLVFGGAISGEMDRYATRQDALAGHEAMVARVRSALQ